MGKKKRARITQRSPSPPAPLGVPSLDKRPPPKSQEEIELEEAVFGRAALRDDAVAGKGKRRLVWDDEDDELVVAKGLGGMGHVEDQDLFFVDAPATNGAQAHDSEEDPDEAPDSEAEDDRPAQPLSALTSLRQSSKPAWSDPSDSTFSISLTSGPSRLRKLRTSAADDRISGAEYEVRLRREFERTKPEPSWVGKARKDKARLKRGREGSDEEDEEDGLEAALRSTGAMGYDGRKGGSRLPRGEIDLARLRDANQADPSPSPISSIAFHPLSSDTFLTASSASRRLKLFRLTGKDFPLLQTVHVPELPLEKAAFEPTQGKTVFLGGPRPFFYTYDLVANRCVKSSPRGLLGSGTNAVEGQGASFSDFTFSPDGSVVAVAGRRGYVNLLDWGSGTTGGRGSQVVGNLKINSPVKGIAFRRQGKEALLLGEDGEVGVWDVGERRCVSRWRDEGGYGTTAVETDRHDRYTAIASKSGIVNLYDDAGSPVGAERVDGRERKAVKMVDNLTTSVGTVRFNHDSQVMALASRVKKDQLKLVHLPSGTVFSNWPTSGTPLGHVYDVAFSPDGGRLAIGNSKGKVLLYSLGWWAKSKR